jgi:hypothetical protein
MTMNEIIEKNASPVLLKKSTVIHQTSQGPTVNQVAAQTLREALNALYPHRQIDPDRTMIGTPQWQLADDILMALPTRFESLTEALVRQFFNATTARFLDGEHFLTLDARADPVVHLDIDIAELAQVFNENAPLLFIAFAQLQLNFWNNIGHHEPRWQELSDALRKALDVQHIKGWDELQCRVARAVSKHPDKQQRLQENPRFSGLKACLIDIDTVDTKGVSHHLVLGGAAVITGRYEQRDLLMMYTVETGYESFDSLQKLGESLPARVKDLLAGRDLKWQLFEPEGNFFDHMAWALVASQLDAIVAINSESPAAQNDDDFAASSVLAEGASVQEQAAVARLDEAIPDWLFIASPADLDAYGQSINALGKLYKHSETDLFQIPPITTYARDRMRDAIIADQPSAARLPLDELEISITDSFEVDGLALPDPHSRYTETLGEYALQNAPPYQATLRFKNAQPVPAWLTVTYLTQTASNVDVGAVYPRLIKSKLVDDPAQARLQERFYIGQMRALLPLIALEYKNCGIGGIDAQGAHLIHEWLKSPSGYTSAVRIRPLAFVHDAKPSGDTVANMFIIESSTGIGPCVLYRPLSEQPLLQFPAAQNLLYDLHQPGELRDSILAWLPDSVTSNRYAQYVFPSGLPSPWLGVQLLVEPWTADDWVGPIRLSTQVLTGDVFASLFKTHALAMAELADRQSLSNAQRRWQLLRDCGWAVFNIAANFLSGPAGAAIWVWQSIGEIDQVVQARRRGDVIAQWDAVADLLLTLGMLLAHRVATRRKIGPEPATRASEASRPVPVPVIVRSREPEVSHTTDLLIGELPSSHYSSLEANGSVPRRTPTALGLYLDGVSVAAPDLVAAQLQTLLRGRASLYRLGDKTYAQVGERWFNVVEDEDQRVQIAYPDTSGKTGPLLIHNQQGHWFVDTRLRLLGGAGGTSLQAQRRRLRKEREQQEKQLAISLDTFKRQEATNNLRLKSAQERLMAETGEGHEQATAAYLTQVEKLITGYEQALKDLQKWQALGGREGYVGDLLRMSTELQKNLSLWFVLKRNAYARLTHTLAREISSETADALLVHTEGVRKALALSQEMIARLDLSQQSLVPLDAAGRQGKITAQRLRKLLPAFTPWDLRSNEIGMSHELCMRAHPAANNEAARQAVGQLIIDAATASHRHCALMRTPFAPDATTARIDSLSALLDNYADANQRLLDVASEYSDSVEKTGLDRVRGLVAQFRQLAQEQLNTLLPEGGGSSAPVEPKIVATKPSKLVGKVTKSRPHNPEPSTAALSEQQPLEEIIPARPRPTPPSTLDDTAMISEGLDLNDGVKGFIERTRKDAFRPERIPADMQDLFELQANRLEQAAINVERAINRIRTSGQTPPPVGNLSPELKTAANGLRMQGVDIRAEMLKERPPRQAYVQWLLDNKRVRIIKNTQGRIKTKKRQDYFQEYQILDLKNHDQPIWLAHFHYDSAEAPLEQFTAAHLKIADPHLQQFNAERRKALTTLAPVDYVLRRVSDPTMFFALEK